MNNKIWADNESVCMQYAQALRVIREQVGENPTRNLEHTARVDTKALGCLVDVVSKHHEILSGLEDPGFFSVRSAPPGSRQTYQATTPVGSFLFGMSFG